MSVDETEWNDWKSTHTVNVIPWLGAQHQLGYSFTVPQGQGDSRHKSTNFVFSDGHALDNTELYYGVGKSILYTGLYTADESIFKSEEFREACVLLTQSYCMHYDPDKRESIIDMSRERAEEIVDYILNADGAMIHAVVDDLRIRSVRSTEDPTDIYFTYHLEY